MDRRRTILLAIAEPLGHNQADLNSKEDTVRSADVRLELGGKQDEVGGGSKQEE